MIYLQDYFTVSDVIHVIKLKLLGIILFPNKY